jgi:alpha-mannosidase
VAVIERGPIRAALRVTSTWGDSTVVQEISLARGRRRIDWTLEIDWHEQLKALKLAVPVNVGDPAATFDIPYGAIVRERTGNEEPLQFWMDLTGRAAMGEPSAGALGRGRYGVALLNDCKYGGDALGSEMRLTLLRSPAYAFHDPRIIEQGVTYEWTDQGQQVVRCALLPHRGGWQDAPIAREAWALNVPMIARLERAHGGDFDPMASFVEGAPENVVVTVVKKAEDNDDMVVRLYETNGREGEVVLSLPADGARCAFPLRPFEIKTIRCAHRGRKLAAREVDMLERLREE